LTASLAAVAGLPMTQDAKGMAGGCMLLPGGRRHGGRLQGAARRL